MNETQQLGVERSASSLRAVNFLMQGQLTKAETSALGRWVFPLFAKTDHKIVLQAV
jgi:hypothetical protein